MTIITRAPNCGDGGARRPDQSPQLGTPMTVTVVDEAGRLVLRARGNGAGFFTPETSRAKAVAGAEAVRG